MTLVKLKSKTGMFSANFLKCQARSWPRPQKFSTAMGQKKGGVLSMVFTCSTEDRDLRASHQVSNVVPAFTLKSQLNVKVNYSSDSSGYK